MATDGFDISTILSDDTTTIEILHPKTGEPIPGVTATIYGQDSEAFKAADRKAKDRFFAYVKKNPRKTMPSEDRERIELETLVSCVKSINGLMMGGTPMTDVAEIFRLVPDIKDQIDKAVIDRANFIKG